MTCQITVKRDPVFTTSNRRNIVEKNISFLVFLCGVEKEGIRFNRVKKFVNENKDIEKDMDSPFPLIKIFETVYTTENLSVTYKIKVTRLHLYRC